MNRLASLNTSLKGYDRYLEAKEHRLNRIDIYRRSQFDVTPPHFIFSLTHDWRPSGKPVPWGVEVVLSRIKAHDLWRDDTFIERYLEQTEKDKAAKEKSFKNNIESFLWDFRSQFKKAFGDVNTANLKKLYRKDPSHGYSKSRLGL